MFYDGCEFYHFRPCAQNKQGKRSFHSLYMLRRAFLVEKNYTSKKYKYGNDTQHRSHKRVAKKKRVDPRRSLVLRNLCKSLGRPSILPFHVMLLIKFNQALVTLKNIKLKCVMQFSQIDGTQFYGIVMCV